MNLAEQLEFQDTIPGMNTSNAEAQINLLHSKADKYITIATIDENKQYQQWHFTLEELNSNLNKIISLGRNTYMSVNEFYVPKRSPETIRRINALYTDLDLVNKKYKITDFELDMAIEILQDEYFNKVIPEPTMIIKTGRGLHLYWKIEDLPKQGLGLWTMVQQKVIERLDNFTESFRLLKVDQAVKDCTRVTRMGNTKNLKSNTMCTVEAIYEENIYRLDTLIKEYFTELEIIEKNKKTKGKAKTKSERSIIAMHNLYTLHHARLQDIVKLQELRNGAGNVDYRRRMCFFYRYYSSLFTHDTELALENTLDFNSKFTYPLTDNEARQASQSAEKAYEEWLTNKAEDFKKPVWNSETGTYNIKGYNYRNTSIIRELEITEEEQVSMLTIISKKEKKRRQCEKEKADRRNENGLTPKQQELKHLKTKILLIQNEKQLSMRKLADELDVSLGKIQRALKSEY